MTTAITQLPEIWQQHWQKAGFNDFSLIQAATFQPLSDGLDVLGISPTGSGKTLAYLLPLLQKVIKGEGNQLLILASSQELSMQVFEVAQTWATDLDLSVQAIIGGANVKRQIEKLKRKPEILVGTSGRILELIKQRKIKVSQIKMVVFDEADQLLADSMTEDLIKAVGKQNQFAFFSATGNQMLEKIKTLGSEIKIIDVSAQDLSTAQMAHFYLRVAPRKRSEYLRSLAHVENFQALVFFNELSDLGNIDEKLIHHQLSVSSLASDQNKLVRKAAVQKFREGKLTLLLATDVAARGLDIPNLPYVINYELPFSEESYLHRGGRTGRMGKTGNVITFVHDGNLKNYLRMIKKMKFETQEIFLYGGRLHKEPQKNPEPKNKSGDSQKFHKKKKT